MALSAEQLIHELAAGRMDSVYFVHGDEPLARLEALDAIRAALRREGADERISLQSGTGFDWGGLEAEMASRSLFGGRRWVELDVPTGKPGAEGSKAIVRACELASADCCFVLTTGRLEKEQRNARWVQALDAAGSNIECRVPDRSRLPDWVRQRARRNGLTLSPEAVAVLAERSEGNLFACQQAIQHLALLHPEGEVDAAAVLAATGDAARFSVFSLADAVLAGESERALRVLDGLRGEGIEAVLVSWSLRRELRTLALLAPLEARGRGLLEKAYGRLRIWPARQFLYGQALKRLSSARITHLYAASLAIDRAVKGAERNLDPWDGFTWIVLGACGLKVRASLLPM
jgi:DNA polymerase III subunit delta